MRLPELIVVQAESTIAAEPRSLLSAPPSLTALLEKAQVLRRRAEAAGVPCQIDVVSVLHEPIVDWRNKVGPDRDKLQRMIVEHAQRRLDAQLERILDRGDNVKGVILWNKQAWRAVHDYAEAQYADLIIRTNREVDDENRYSKFPDDWQLLRHSSIPVLLTKAQPWHEPTAVVVAMDAFAKPHDALNARLLAQARTMAQLLAAHTYVISTFPRLRPLIVELGLFEGYADQEASLRAEGAARIGAALRQAGINDAAVDVQSGEPRLAIQEAVDRVGPAIVVVGTNAREGLSAAFLGNTCEELIHRLQSDLLVVPKP